MNIPDDWWLREPEPHTEEELVQLENWRAGSWEKKSPHVLEPPRT